jgi:hypothetical protein
MQSRFSCLYYFYSPSTSSRHEKNPTIILEAGTAAIRSAQFVVAEQWPPVPDDNYRRSHFVVHPSSSSDRRSARSGSYAFGESFVSDEGGSKQVSSRVSCRIKRSGGKKEADADHPLSQYLSSIVSSLASPDSDGKPNRLVIVSSDLLGTLDRLHELRKTVQLRTFPLPLALLSRDAVY